MENSELELKLQNEIDALVSKNKDVFSAVLGVTDVRGNFYWAGAAGSAYPDGAKGMKVDTPIYIASITKSGLSPKFPPESKEQEKSGKKAYYSDTNYQLLGAVIEAVAQKPLSDVFSELIIEPLELSSTCLHNHENPKKAQKNPPANMYYKTQPLYLDKAMTSFGPDGGMVSNVEDSLKFLKHFMGGQLFSQPSTL